MQASLCGGFGSVSVCGQPSRRVRSVQPAALRLAVTLCMQPRPSSHTRERERLERLVRYMARPALSDERVTAVDDNTIRLRLKSPWKDGTESLLFTPSEFIEKLIALVPIPRFPLTRYFGKKRLTWAALLKRTFKIDVLTCGRCGGPMTLIHVALGPFEIETTLIALGLSPRARPVAPARSSGIFGGWVESTSEPWPAD